MRAQSGLWRGRTPFIAILLLHIASISIFVHGYLLTRVHMQQRSTPDSPVCARPYRKLVWIVIDALRYDFVVADSRYPCPPGVPCSHQGNMPRLSALLHHPHAAKAFRYVADAPTTTTQRLKAMVSGGLPTFFDISSTFTAGAMDEDNLIEQLAASGRSLAFMGDATWPALFPSAFNTSLSFPCFNVKDLDSVDDGIWQHLLPTLQRPGDWDVLIAHYLGVDHAGHTHGVRSTRMAAKLQQMDAHVAAVVKEMAAGAGPGGAYEDALLVVSGDHGQTLGGDHGGGSPEEVDSALVVVDVAALRSALKEAQQQPSSRTHIDGVKIANTAGSGATIVSACRASCTCGDDGNQCADDLPQIDLVPTLAALLGVPVPFANLGGVSPELWSLAAGRCRREGEGWETALARATAAAAAQVHTYLHTYAHTSAAGLPRAALRQLDSAFQALPPAARCTFVPGGGIDAHLAFLVQAQALARDVWTQFRVPSMVAGLALFAAALGYHAAAAWAALGAGREAATCAVQGLSAVVSLLLSAGAAVQALGIFSFFYLLSEGRVVSLLVAVMTGLLTLAGCTQAWQHSGAGRGRRCMQLAALGALALACNGAAAWLGLARHSGYGFWKRLTVHEPADAGPGSGRSSPAHVSFTAAALHHMEVLVDGIPAAWRALAAHTFMHTLPIMTLGEAALRRMHASTLLQILVRSAYVVIAMQHLVDLAIQQAWVAEGLTLAGALQVAATTSSLRTTLPPLPAALVWCSRILTLPVNLLLPRAALALCVVSAAVLASVTSQSAAHTVSGISAVLLAVLALVSSSRPPLLLLLLAVEVAALTRLLASHSAGVQRTASGGRSTLVVCSLGAVMAAVQTQAYFVTGHLCEFAGLQYTAAFVGWDDFQLHRSALLLGIDTFGGMSLVALAVPATVVAAHAWAEKGAAPAADPLGDHSGSSSTVAGALLLFSAVRAACAFCATLSAAVQRRHLYAWALFAPKFVFEVLFMLVTDLVVALLSCCWT